jgi:prophage regulatory protein
MALKVDTTKVTPDQLPLTGFVRASDLLKFMPFKKSTLWAWSKNGKFVSPIRIGSITVWRCEQIWEWINAQGKEQVACHAEGK